MSIDLVGYMQGTTPHRHINDLVTNPLDEPTVTFSGIRGCKRCGRSIRYREYPWGEREAVHPRTHAEHQCH